GLTERARRHVADIAVAEELAPRPAVMVVVDRDPLALEGFGLQSGLGRRLFADRRRRGGDLERLAVDEALGGHHAFELPGGEVGPRRRGAWSEAAAGRDGRLLRARREWPGGCAAQQRHEVAPLHPIGSIKAAAAGAARGTRRGTPPSSRSAHAARAACRSP